VALLAAAACPRADAGPAPEPGLRFKVLVPAHDEAAGLPATLGHLRRLDHPAHLYEVVVIADNCTDATAAVARDAGATVLERDAPDARGKGQALAWALERLTPGTFDAVAVVDADCVSSPGLLRAFERELRAGAAAVQADYRVSNGAASEAAALRATAFVLHNTIRPLGRHRLGLSAGLLGTGMAFRADVLERVPWHAYGVAEDREYHYRLVAAGERVAFAPDAAVASDMPESDAAARTQQLRWEGDKGALARTWIPRLVRDGLARRDPVRLEAALEGLMLPQAGVAISAGAGVALAALARDRRALRIALLAIAAQAVYVAGGLAVGGAPAGTARAVRAAPRLLASRAAVLARALRGRGPTRWVRTDRT
jgi:hypothetical protein